MEHVDLSNDITNDGTEESCFSQNENAIFVLEPVTKNSEDVQESSK